MIVAAAAEEITTTMDADAEMETIMDSLADLGGYSYQFYYLYALVIVVVVATLQVMVAVADANKIAI